MSLARLRARIPGAIRLGLCLLEGHDLRFHMQSDDGSGKCDAYRTASSNDIVMGALFEITACEKQALDVIEGLGLGYDQRVVSVRSAEGVMFEAITYSAIRIESSLKPYSWYLNHVVVGAREIQVPLSYLKRIQAIESIEDTDRRREIVQRAVHSG